MTHRELKRNPVKISVWQPGVTSLELKLRPKFTFTSTTPDEDVTVFIIERSQIPDQFSYLRKGLPLKPEVPQPEQSCLLFAFTTAGFLNPTLLRLDQAVSQAHIIKHPVIREINSRAFGIQNTISSFGGSGGMLSCDRESVAAILTGGTTEIVNGSRKDAETVYSLFDPSDMLKKTLGY